MRAGRGGHRAALLVAAPLWAAAGCGPSGPSAPTGDAAELAALAVDGLSRDNLERMARAIVHYERPSGSDGENAAIDSVVAALREAGVPVTVHTFDTYASDPVSASVEVPGTDLRFDAITMAYSGAADGLTAPLVDVGTLDDLPRLELGTDQRLALLGDAQPGRDVLAGLPNVRGAIALVGGQPRNIPTAALALMGAAGVVFMNPEERLNDLIVTSTWGTPSLRSYHRLPTIPTVQVTRSAGEALRMQAARRARVRISAEVRTGRKPLRLAVARIEGPTPDAPYVLLGGHIDAWYHGGTDEGASNAAMVELARVFQENRDRLRRGLVVAWWPGHSNARYAGSTWFADHFYEELRDRAVAYMNVDGIGQMGAVRFSTSATEALVPLAERAAAPVSEGLHVSTPGRNSDQSFNGIGLPLLQFNHVRSGEDGGYWWWHTPDDTFDKIDFDVLRTDASLYARALAALLAEPVLPLDLSAQVGALGDVIRERQEQAGEAFDLSEARERQARLLQAVGRIEAALSGHQGPELDRALVRVLRPVYRVMYDSVDPYHPDPGFGLGLLPGLAPLEILSTEDPASDRYLFALTTLVRERNRLMEALDRANEEAERTLQMLEEG